MSRITNYYRMYSHSLNNKEDNCRGYDDESRCCLTLDSVSIPRHVRESTIHRHRPHGPRCVSTDIPRHQPDWVGDVTRNIS
jgi:hypothetical protein